MSDRLDALRGNIERQHREGSVRVASDVEWLVGLVDRLTDALEWYAEPTRHLPTQARHPQTAAAGDGGARARAALVPVNPEPKVADADV